MSDFNKQALGGLAIAGVVGAIAGVGFGLAGPSASPGPAPQSAARAQAQTLTPPTGQCQSVTALNLDAGNTYEQWQICVLPDAGQQGLPPGLVTVDPTASTPTPIGPTAVIQLPDGGRQGLVSPSAAAFGCQCPKRIGICAGHWPDAGVGPAPIGHVYPAGMLVGAACLATTCTEVYGYHSLPVTCE